MSPPVVSLTPPDTSGSPVRVPASAPPVALSYELFPPRSAAAEHTLWSTIRELEATAPDYVSVTYGASGSNHDTAIDLITRLQRETLLRPLAHLTCVGNSEAALVDVVTQLLDHGVRGILALRGDLPRDGSPIPAGSLAYARDLVELIRQVEQQRSALLCAGKVAIGVAAYPTRHPESPSEAHDIEVLLAKQRAGADFAITQVFFHPEQYANLLVRARRAGVTIPLIPGVMPLTSVRRLKRLAELSGVAPHEELLDRLERAGDAAEQQRIGVQATVDLANAALDAGAQGLHIYTFNEHRHALDVLDRLSLPRPKRPLHSRDEAMVS
ncbi:methylenetetrahydrofolate reductase [Psychromicrobium xiongbiense]|uniref:methylenetetrahydrofolate reductase n=1 Tax=Psychromicrobium xiongbiense TaxID=3051184 RepID=UPI002555949D|nr:methylenetetrahydrofolate reductase [Psychromicrobium sp. YIM S02556]